MISKSDRIRWQERAFLTRREVASIFARSVEWVSDSIADGDLVAVRQRRGGPLLVDVESVLNLRDRLRHGLPSLTPLPRLHQQPALRLVWINPHV